MTEFTPPPEMPWASYIEGRRPKFKVHATKAHALRAVNVCLTGRFDRTTRRYVSTVRGGVVYELVDGRWLERERVEAGRPRVQR